jgi:hypothetical protein
MVIKNIIDLVLIKTKTHAIKDQLLINLEKVNKIKPLIAWVLF